MLSSSQQRIAHGLTTLSSGDHQAANGLLEVVYEELRAQAAGFLRRQRLGHTLQPTALVHEAFLKVRMSYGEAIQDQAHFAALCAVTMRSILTDHARRRGSAKRGGEARRITLADVHESPGSPGFDRALDLLDLEAALSELTEKSERQALIVQYRFFGGMTVEEVAHVLEISRTTVEADWRMARAWLNARLGDSEDT